MKYLTVMNPRIILGLYTFVLMAIVWSPVKADGGKLLGLFLVSGILEKLLNLILFVPLPLLIREAFSRLSLVTLLYIGPVATVTIEIVQRFIPGRVSDLSDIVMNTLGYWMALFFSLRLRSKKQGQ